MNKEFNLETKDEIKRHIDHGVIRLATELKESIEDNFTKANEKIINQQVLINTLEDRIDKVIECLEEGIDFPYYDDDTKKYLKGMKDILKGEEDERI